MFQKFNFKFQSVKLQLHYREIFYHICKTNESYFSKLLFEYRCELSENYNKKFIHRGKKFNFSPPTIFFHNFSSLGGKIQQVSIWTEISFMAVSLAFIMVIFVMTSVSLSNTVTCDGSGMNND